MHVHAQEHYGKEGEAHAAGVKKLYDELGLPEVYERQEEDSYARISAMIKSAEKILPPTIFRGALDKVRGVSCWDTLAHVLAADPEAAEVVQNGL